MATETQLLHASSARYMLLSALLLGGGCASLFDNGPSVSRQEEAASSHIAVLSVAPWDSYRDAVQANFKLAADDALALAVPNTMDLEQKWLSAFGATLKVALPGTTMTATKTLQQAAGQAPTQSEASTQTSSSGQTSNLTFSPSPAGSRTASSLPPSTSVLGTPIGMDPVLRYQVANAVFQEVQILDHYVKDAAIPEGYIPYFVRLQVGVMPLMRNLPYDAYSVISFFHGSFGGTAASEKRIQVLPLLVTDDLESMMESRSVDQLRQYAVALSAVLSGMGLSGDIQKVNEKLQTVLGHDYNSTFTLGRVSDNTIECRFGAAYAAKTKYTMISQTHNVSLIILLPKEAVADRGVENRTVRVVSKTTLRDPKNGNVLASQGKEEALREVCSRVRKLGIKDDLKPEDASKLLLYLASNDYKTFHDAVKSIDSNATYTEATWVELTALMDRHAIHSATLTVPRQDPELTLEKPTLRSGQIPLLLDDGKSGMSTTVSLEKATSLLPAQIAAQLTIEPKPADPTSFAPADLLDLASLAAKLKNQPDPVSAALAKALSPGSHELLGKYDGGPNADLEKGLVNDLNRIIRSGSLENADGFKAAPLSAETKALFATHPTGTAVVHANWLLLADSYPAELARPPASAPVPVTLNSTAVSVGGYGSLISVNFPSVADYKLTEGSGVLGGKAKISLFTVGEHAKLIFQDQPCNYFLQPDALKAGFSLSTRSKFIDAAADNTASLQLLFTDKKASAAIRFAVLGAEVAPPSPVDPNVKVTADKEGWVVSTNGTVNLNLSNLSFLSPVVISATDTNSKVALPQIVLPVVPRSVNRPDLVGH